MLDYTRALISKTEKDIERAIDIFHFGVQIVYIAYLVYAICTLSNIWYLQLALLVVSIPFLVYDIIATKNLSSLKKEKVSFFKKKAHKKLIGKAKKKRSKVLKVKFYLSHTIKLFVLISAFYPIIITPDTVHPISIMCTTVMVLLWFLSVILELFKIVISGRFGLFSKALQADIEFIYKPADFVKDTFNKIRGKEIEEKPEPTKERKYLDGLVKVVRDERVQKKAAEKLAKKEKRSAWLNSHLSKRRHKKNASSPSDDSLDEATATETLMLETTEEV